MADMPYENDPVKCFEEHWNISQCALGCMWFDTCHDVWISLEEEDTDVHNPMS